MTLTPETEHLLQIFILFAGILLVPVMVGVLVVLFKLAFLIHSSSEFLAAASSELSPLIKELRLMVGHLEDIGKQASSGMQGLGNSLSYTRPIVTGGLRRLRLGASAVVSGISRSFGKTSD